MILPDLLDGRDDSAIGAATADVPAHALFHVRIALAARFFEQCDRGHDLSGRAIAALISIMLDECGLHRVQGARRAQTFNGSNLRALLHERQAQARVHSTAIDMHGAGAALAMVAPFLRACESHCFAKAIQQSGSGIDLERVIFSVDPEGDRDSSQAGVGGILTGFSSSCRHVFLSGHERGGGGTAYSAQKIAARWIGWSPLVTVIHKISICVNWLWEQTTSPW
jgi:hypothetical protein